MPKSMPEPRAATRTLETKDIQGADADSKRLGAFTHYKRKDEAKALT